MPIQELPGVLQQPNGFLLLELFFQFSSAEITFLNTQTPGHHLALILQWTMGPEDRAPASPWHMKGPP